MKFWGSMEGRNKNNDLFKNVEMGALDEYWKDLLTGAMDFFEAFFRILSTTFTKFHETLVEFSKEKEKAIDFLNSIRRLRALYSVLMLSLACFISLPDETLNRKEILSERISRYGALVYYHWEATKEFLHSITLSFSGLYATSHSLIRSCVETLTWGIMYDALARCEYRKKAIKELRDLKIESPKSRKWRSWGEFLDSLGKEDLSSSARMLDALDGCRWKLKIGVCRRQLVEWKLLENSESEELKEIYGELSEYVHRSIPDRTDVGIRVAHEVQYDWVDFEVVPDAFLEFQKNAERALRTPILALARYMSSEIKKSCYSLNRRLFNWILGSVEILNWRELLDILKSVEGFFK